MFGSREGSGVAERLIRTFKAQLLWVERFATGAELLEALHALKDRYNRSGCSGSTAPSHRRHPEPS